MQMRFTLDEHLFDNDQDRTFFKLMCGLPGTLFDAIDRFTTIPWRDREV